jgi:hypothetical protein
MLRRAHISLVALLVGAYLSTWSAALLQTIVFPAIGPGPEKVSSSDSHGEEKPRVGLFQRRHTPLVKTLSPMAPPPAENWYPGRVTWVQRIHVHHSVTLTYAPEYSPHIGRAPPTV